VWASIVRSTYLIRLCSRISGRGFAYGVICGLTIQLCFVLVATEYLRVPPRVNLAAIEEASMAIMVANLAAFSAAAVSARVVHKHGGEFVALNAYLTWIVTSCGLMANVVLY
jgi:hypothetical protein